MNSSYAPGAGRRFGNGQDEFRGPALHGDDGCRYLENLAAPWPVGAIRTVTVEGECELTRPGPGDAACLRQGLEPIEPFIPSFALRIVEFRMSRRVERVRLGWVDTDGRQHVLAVRFERLVDRDEIRGLCGNGAFVAVRTAPRRVDYETPIGG